MLKPFLTALGIAWFIGFSLLGAWSISTPLGASPDEPAHLVKAASVARGEYIGKSGIAEGQVVLVPEYVAFVSQQLCFARDEDASAACAPEERSTDPGRLVTASTTAGLYNPVYYSMTGWPSLLFHNEAGVYGMRLVSALIVALFLAVPLALLRTWKRATVPVIGFMVATTPMVLFLGGVENPNALEIAATLSTFVSFYSVMHRRSPIPAWLQWAIVALSASIAVNMRGLSALWVAVVILSVLVSVSRKDLASRFASTAARAAVIVIVAATIGALVWLFSTNSLGTGLEGSGSSPNSPETGTSALVGFAYTLLSTAEYGRGVIGVFGWLDTPAPPFVYFVWSTLIGGLLVLCFTLVRTGKLAMASILTLSTLLLPPLLQGAYITGGGIIWQGRYILPVFVCLMVGLAIALGDRVALPSGTRLRLSVIVAAAWVAAQFFAFATALRRYAVGLDQSWGHLLPIEWSPPGGFLFWLLVFGILTLATGIGFVAASSAIRERADSPRGLTISN